MLKTLHLEEIIPEALQTQGGRILPLNTREVLFHKNDPIRKVYLLLTGSLSLQNAVDSLGDPVIYSFKRPGQFLGILAYLDSSLRYTATAISMEPSTLLEIPAPQFLAALHRYPLLLSTVQQQLTHNFRELQLDRDIQKSPAAVRLATLLLNLFKEQQQNQGRTIQMTLTKKSLAKKIGSEPETVVRLLAAWSRQNIIKSEDKRIEICNVSALERLAHFKFSTTL